MVKQHIVTATQYMNGGQLRTSVDIHKKFIARRLIHLKHKTSSNQFMAVNWLIVTQPGAKELV
jgi:esterase/lipase superfamily enzyme|tara:strand:- start:490 stop:678 length:189 start_codon:yes stop_codon:yes gene_type:complete